MRAAVRSPSRRPVAKSPSGSWASQRFTVFKPRGQWHTFWNAGDTPVRLLEIISPGGLEKLFRNLGEPGGDYDPETLPALAAIYGCDVDFERTMPIIERHRLLF